MLTIVKPMKKPMSPGQLAVMLAMSIPYEELLESDLEMIKQGLAVDHQARESRRYSEELHR